MNSANKTVRKAIVVFNVVTMDGLDGASATFTFRDGVDDVGFSNPLRERATFKRADAEYRIALLMKDGWAKTEEEVSVPASMI